MQHMTELEKLDLIKDSLIFIHEAMNKAINEGDNEDLLDAMRISGIMIDEVQLLTDRPNVTTH